MNTLNLKIYYWVKSMTDNDDKINEIIEKNASPQKTQLADILFSSIDMISRIHNLRNMMIETISDPSYISQLDAEQWALINDSITKSESTEADFVNSQTRIAEKVPAAQNIYTVLAGQINNTQNTIQIEDKSSNKEEEVYEIPAEIRPIQQAIQSTLDSRMGIDRSKIIEEYESSNINEDLNNEQQQ